MLPIVIHKLPKNNMNLTELKKMPMPELLELAHTMGLENIGLSVVHLITVRGHE